MDPQKELLEDLLKQRKELQTKLVEIQQEHNTMKEQYIRMQGAIDVLEHLLGEVKDPEIPPEAFPPSPVDTDS
tara:strand:- start:860 stop:1078 length:219 start_codon:yes stop_codon:yes gene_type:complete